MAGVAVGLGKAVTVGSIVAAGSVGDGGWVAVAGTAVGLLVGAVVKAWGTAVVVGTAVWLQLTINRRQMKYSLRILGY